MRRTWRPAAERHPFPALLPGVSLPAVWLVAAGLAVSATWAGQQTTGLDSLSHPAVADDPQEDDPQFQSLFDGRTLDGWQGDERLWSVRDGAISGQTTADAPLEANSFLIWTGGEPADFELRLKWRIVGGNSGIQYRSRHEGNFVVSGYQADLDGAHRYTGILYEERGRGILAQRGQRVSIDRRGQRQVSPLDVDPAEMIRSLEEGQWYDYVIIARGNRLIQIVDGVTTVDVTDDQPDHARSSGIIGFQLHTGPPMLVEFKDIRLRQFTRPDDR